MTAFFTTVRSQGAILPPDVLQRVVDRDPTLGGLSADSYHLGGETIGEATSRAWAKLQRAWAAFGEAEARLPETDLGTSLTRERWLLLLFQELGYGRLATARAVELGGKAFPISHAWGEHTPIHLVGCRVDLDKRTPRVAGAAGSSPHGLVQEFLNRSAAHVWGFVSNGLTLRILRDNASLTRQAFVEFDLRGMFDGEVYADFVLLWLLGHQSRVEGDNPAESWLEQWSLAAREQGTRALDRLRDGVERAIEALGAGFLEHPSNQTLRERLQHGALLKEDYYRQLLRVVYRLIFLMVAEDRGLLLEPGSSEEAQRCFLEHYSLLRLRRVAQRLRGTRHCDLWQGLTVVMRGLGDDAGCSALGLPSLGSSLWARESVPDLDGGALSNRALLAAVRALAFASDVGALRPVDYRNLGAEELGSVYESLLELQPMIDVRNARFNLETVAGSERKTTGSYYTPSSLIDSLLDSALDPVLEEAASKPNPEQAILALKVCDPACGSGHFLIAAAQRIGKRLASVRTGELEPSPEEVRRAVRDVVGHCIYGVDINPMAAELCKVSLWLEAMEPGRPLSFLDHRIRVGNSLLGATPALVAAGIPDDAFVALEGDVAAIVRDLKKRNKREREGQTTLFVELRAGAETFYSRLSALASEAEAIGDDSIVDVHQQEEGYRRLSGSIEYRRARLVADAWCAAFVWRRANGGHLALTQGILHRLGHDPAFAPPDALQAIERLAEQYRFFHWHLAFPEIYRPLALGEEPTNVQAGWTGGFDIVLGNPPWERIKLQEKEWFAFRRPDIADAPNAAARRRMIIQLEQDDPALWAAWLEDSRQAEGESHFVRNSGRYPLCGRGDINTYAAFAELMRTLVHPFGRVGCIVPSGIATDEPTKFFFGDIVTRGALASLYEFENEGFFAVGQGHMVRFALVTLVGSQRRARAADFVFQAKAMHELANKDRHFSLTSADIELLSPNTGTCPIFRTGKDAEITKAIYKRLPVLVREGEPADNPWELTFATMFHLANDSGLFKTRDELESDGWQLEANIFVRGGARYLPVYEARMLHQFTHRFGDYGTLRAGEGGHVLPEVPISRLEDPDYAPLPRYWVEQGEVDSRLPASWGRRWLMGWRDITDARASARSVVAAALPRVGVGNTFPLFFPNESTEDGALELLACLNSIIFDYCARQKIGGLHLTYHILRQLPVPRPEALRQRAPWSPRESLRDWLRSRVLELVFTAADLTSCARDFGYEGLALKWDVQRRSVLRAELDAAFLHVYGLSRAEVDFILNTFPVVQREDEAMYGEYRTKRLIVERYDAIARAIETGVPYETALDPPPGDQSVAHSAPALAKRPAATAKVLPFRRLSRAPKPTERYVTAVPLLTLKAAAGSFGQVRDVEFDEWVEPANPPKLQKGMFLAQVVGRSMEPEIADGAYCLFRYVRPGSREGKVVLVQLHGYSDPETGGRYTVKRYHSEKVRDEDGGWRHARIVLRPTNPAHKAIVLQAEDEGEVKVVAELVKVL